ncbi:MAG: hypothetical protein DRJ41_02500 [Thermoprotei archaeon]|nr:MAG: hypothetical protein DRJ41_02500 [Thermoprotei archaeon]
MLVGKIIVEFEDDKEAKLFYEALKPEELTAPSYRSKVKISHDVNKLTIIINSKDVSSLRASVNSFLRLLNVLGNLKL